MFKLVRVASIAIAVGSLGAINPTWAAPVSTGAAAVMAALDNPVVNVAWQGRGGARGGGVAGRGFAGRGGFVAGRGFAGRGFAGPGRGFAGRNFVGGGWRGRAAAGFAAGVIGGAAIAGASRYYYAPDAYAYDAPTAYEGEPEGYGPAPEVEGDPGPAAPENGNGCWVWTDQQRGHGYDRCALRGK